jgi:predicted acetyltransferase
MGVEIRVIEAEQWAEFVRAVFVPFGGTPTEQDVEDTRIEFEPGRSIAAYDGDHIVGNTSVISLKMTVPGGAAVSTAGVTTVGVSPTHRRRGILRSMMRRQSDDSHDQGYAIAALWASEPPIYQRFGYGLATRQAGARIPRAYTQWLAPAPADPGQVRLIAGEAAAKELDPVYDRVRGETPGMLARNKKWWRYRFRHLDAEHHRGGFGPMFYALHEGAEGPDAYAVYRVKIDDDGDGIDRGVVQVVETAATTPGSVRAMWSYLFGIDLVETIDVWNRPPDDPLFSMVLDLRRVGPRVVDGLWLRLLDVPAALSARRYGVDGRLVFELQDEFCSWNAGRYELTGGPDGAECAATDAEPELTLTSNELGAVYLGGTRLRDLARAGRVTEDAPGAVARADAMFAGDREPWCPHQF